jgi:hypothetical protein
MALSVYPSGDGGKVVEILYTCSFEMTRGDHVRTLSNFPKRSSSSVSFRVLINRHVLCCLEFLKFGVIDDVWGLYLRNDSQSCEPVLFGTTSSRKWKNTLIIVALNQTIGCMDDDDHDKYQTPRSKDFIPPNHSPAASLTGLVRKAADPGDDDVYHR